MTLEITTELVKELRDATGVSIMQCKNALTEAGGDMAKALEILKKTSAEIALKKSDREVKEGAVFVKNQGNNTVMLALHCETDFVSKNDDFKGLMSTLADKVLTDGVEKTKEEAKALIDGVIQKTGENIQLGEIHLVTGEVLGHYVHNDKSAAVVSLNGGTNDLAKDIAMHIIATKTENLDELPEQPFIKNPEETVGALLEKSGASIKQIERSII